MSSIFMISLLHLYAMNLKQIHFDEQQFPFMTWELAWKA